jgi:hypothetical protein
MTHLLLLLLRIDAMARRVPQAAACEDAGAERAGKGQTLLQHARGGVWGCAAGHAMQLNTSNRRWHQHWGIQVI